MTILGLISESQAPINGDKLEKVIENRGMRNWTKIGKSSIYHSLKKLARSDHLVITEKLLEREASLPPTKRVFYGVTEFGMDQLHQNVVHNLTTPQQMVDPFTIAFANAPILSTNETHDALVGRIKELVGQKQFLENQLMHYAKVGATGIDIHGNPSPQHLGIIKGLFSRPLAFVMAEIEWITSFIISEGLERIEEST